MALALFSDRFWFPSGVLAAAQPARVFPEGSNSLATLWADAAGTVALPNPLNTDGAGQLTFYAESGAYWIHMDSESFLVHTGMSQEQADLSTGVASGGRMSVNAGNPVALDITAVDGYIVDYLAGTQAQPAVTRVKTPAMTVALSAASLARPVTWWLLDSSGTVVQQGTPPTNEQRRSHIFLGVNGLASGVVSVIQSIPVILPQPVNQLVDLMDALGQFNISGNVISPNGSNLMVDQSSGRVFSRAFNHFNSLGVLTDNPHVSTTLAQTPAQFRYVTRSTVTFGAPITTIDPANYDVGGVVTPVPGGAGVATIQRVWFAPTDTAAEQIIIQYGQTVHSTLAAAVAAIGSGTYVTNVVAESVGMILLGYIAMIRTATNLSDPAQAVFTRASKFANP